MSASIQEIIEGLNYFGYEVSSNDLEKKSNNGVESIQLKIPSKSLNITIFENEKKGNSTPGGSASKSEKELLKDIVEKLKWNSFKDKKLEKEIIYLISSKSESDTHDFKEKWSESKVNLLHDILCLSNTPKKVSSYLIMGVSDNSEIVGLEEHIDQDEINHWFGQLKCFSSDEKPDINIHALTIAGKKIDVLEIIPNDKIPYFLDKDYSHKSEKNPSRSVKKYHIYTRNGDSNTSIDSQSTKNQIEKLWATRLNK